MTDEQKPQWPKTAEGTVDWEVVFEAPDSGLIARVCVAPTPESLHQATVIVIKKLFTRKSDVPEVERFVAQLDALFVEIKGDDAQAAATEAVTTLLRQIKDERIQKANAYIEKKRAEAAGKRRIKRKKERRSDKKKSPILAMVLQVLLVLGKPKVAIPVLAGFLLIVVGGIYLLTPSSPKQAEDEGVVSPPVVAEEPQAPETTKSVDKKDAEQESATPAEEKQEAGPREYVVTLPYIQWPPIVTGIKRKPVLYGLLLKVAGSPEYQSLCARYPAIIDTIQIVFSRDYPRERKARDEELPPLAQKLKTAINQRMGKPLVEQASLYRYGQPGYEVSGRRPCSLAKSTMQP